VRLMATALVLTAASTGCDRTAPAVAEPPSSQDAEPPGEFASHQELWRAVRSGDYEDHVDLELGRVADPPLPAPVEIGFVSGTRPPAEELGALDPLAERLREDDRIRVDLIGCSDPPGSAELNRRISRQRAEAVSEALRARGVPAERVDEVVGRGEDCAVQKRMVRVIPERAAAS